MKAPSLRTCLALASLSVLTLFAGEGPAPRNRDINKADHNGRLPEGNQKDRVRRDHYCKVYTQRMVPGRIYLIDLGSGSGHNPPRSGFFDTWLRVEDSSMNTMAENDNSNGTHNSQLVFKPARDDTYRIVVTSFAPNKTGAYTLRILDFPERAEDAVTRQGTEVASLIDDFHVGDRDVRTRRAGHGPVDARRIVQERQLNPYWREGGNTYCNLFVADVTTALGAEFPRHRNGDEILTNDMYDWASKDQSPSDTGWYPVATGGSFVPRLERAPPSSSSPSSLNHRARFGSERVRSRIRQNAGIRPPPAFWRMRLQQNRARLFSPCRVIFWQIFHS